MKAKITVKGIVQGVGFRPFVYRTAVREGLTGYVQNKGDAGVEILVEGAESAIANFMRDLQEQKPLQARIHGVAKVSLSGKNEYPQFTIIQSSDEIKYGGSVVPPDIAICDDCLKELRDPTDPRFNYFFITCVNCGPRFTIINRLPYDRNNTTMRQFQLCGFCLREYEDPTNRRFHAQTIACPVCGPKAYLTNRNGELLSFENPVHEAGKRLSVGSIVAIKGYGGFHIATSSVQEMPLKRLRESKHRLAKPFALMARSLEAVESFAEVNSKEKELLSSSARPIVLLDKKSNFALSNQIAPNLYNIGVMLPYSAMHYMLFDKVPDIAFVMTSANPANQPIVKSNEEAIQILGDTVDYFLFHDRDIAQRCDDSVTRVHDVRNVFIRRSRGYAPAPIMMKRKTKRCVVGLGGELNNTSCVLNEDMAFLSQHVGDVENVETRDFLKQATENIIKLTNSKIEAVACDLHPKFTTTNLAKELSKENAWELVQVQHHHAHVAALLAEHNVDEVIGVACDGYGFGSDGSAWGGEILLCSRGRRDFTRLGHLESQPLLGGDLATKYPIRIAAGILHKQQNVDQYVLENSGNFPHGKAEAEIFLNLLEKKKNLPQTTSLGRILDAAAALIGVCYQRTYEGEAAMKLESAAIGGCDELKCPTKISGGVIDTTQMLATVYENRRKLNVSDLAFSVHSYLAKSLGVLAVQRAVENGVGIVGFTGGSAVNLLLSKMMREVIESAGLRFLVHETIPSGDGGISMGQAVVGGF